MTSRSDLGRRVAHRRAELRLTTAQVAARARMTPGYLDYVENHSANISPDALRRLARALEVTPADLLGGHAEVPPGGGVPSRLPDLEELGEEECRRLIAPGGVGRVVFPTEAGPAAVPVNYAVVDGAIVFRTMSGGELDRLAGENVGFEVDRLDEAFSRGWSVLVSGQARGVGDPGEVMRLHQIVKPWTGEPSEACVRIEPRRISGRRIHTN
ncbi:helix-turn-helix domain-containing protein [Actinomadura scrupuli]|uniref:helix-turn-helix domain-containing protein n=1 Tax=Actinomadura scrupuli TaxID=559629 RepID=UPI003D9552A2